MDNLVPETKIMIMSHEQAYIVDQIKEGKNICAIACAGSGKTTTITFSGQNCPDKMFLVLTFSRRLSDATKQRIRDLDLRNIVILTYHGFCTKYFGPCRNDSQMKLYVNKAPRGLKDLQKFHVIILDELQDMNALYYAFMTNALKYLNPEIQMGLLGDPKQTIFAFNGGEAKYLIEADKYWNRTFVPCELNTTYRLPHKMNRVVNKLICPKFTMVGDQPFQMVSVDKEHDPPVDYHWIDIYQHGSKLIKSYIARYGKENVLIMAPSIKQSTNDSPIVRIMNELRKAGIDMCTLSDDTPIDEEILDQKLVVSTFHKQKGCEQKCVILVGMDCSYYQYFGNQGTLRNSLNVLYVAWTRAETHLVIIGSNRHQNLPFWSPSDLKELTQAGDLVIHGKPGTHCNCKFMPTCSCCPRDLGISDLIKYKSSHWLDQLVEQTSLDITPYEGPRDIIDLDGKVMMGTGLIEQVSAVYGIMIPIVAEYFEYRQIRRLEEILSEDFLKTEAYKQMPKHLKVEVRDQLKVLYEELQTLDFPHTESVQSDLNFLLGISHHLFPQLSVYLMCYMSYEFPIYQIDNYDWVNLQDVEICALRIIDFRRQLVLDSPNQSETETVKKFPIVCIHQKVRGEMVLSGRMDDLVDDHILEYKIKSTVRDVNDMSQLILYLWTHNKNSGYLVYPNLDQNIHIKIKDRPKFDVFMKVWINSVFREYYKFELKDMASAKPVEKPKLQLKISGGKCLL